MSGRTKSNTARAKLTAHDVWAIRRSVKPRRVLAREHGVSPQSISNIRSRRTWWWL